MNKPQVKAEILNQLHNISETLDQMIEQRDRDIAVQIKRARFFFWGGALTDKQIDKLLAGSR